MGRLIIYTGNGQGKTTAALGLALRMRGAGRRVGIIFFDKGGDFYFERQILKKIGIDFWSFGRRRLDQTKQFFSFGVNKEDKKQAQKGLVLAGQLFKKYDWLILDEILNVIRLKMINLASFLRILKKKSSPLGLVLTGRGCPKEILKIADQVTEMKLVKHPFYSGKKAEKGVDY